MHKPHFGLWELLDTQPFKSLGWGQFFGKKWMFLLGEDVSTVDSKDS